MAIKNAIRMAGELVQKRVNKHIEAILTDGVSTAYPHEQAGADEGMTP